MEKKTFKNPLIEMELDGSCYVVTHSEGLGNPYGQFHTNQWDLEVTFTKKVKPVAVGDVVRYDNYNESHTATVMAIDEDQAWLKFSDGSHATWDVEDLVY